MPHGGKKEGVGRKRGSELDPVGEPEELVGEDDDD